LAASTPIDDKLAKKIASTVRLFASDRPGEAAAAAEAFARILQSAGPDVIHAVAKRIEVTRADMEAVYAAGVAKGRKLEKQEARINGGMFPSSHDMAMWIRERAEQMLRDKERTFVHDMAARSLSRELTEKQEKWLRAIFLRTGGPMMSA